MSNAKLIKDLLASPEFEEAVKGYIETLMKKTGGPAKKTGGPAPGAWDRVVLVEAYTVDKEGDPKSVALVGPFGRGGEHEQFNKDKLMSIGRFNGKLAVGAGRILTPAQATEVKKILKKGKISFETMSRKEAEKTYAELTGTATKSKKKAAPAKKTTAKSKKAAESESDTEPEEESSDSESEAEKPKAKAKSSKGKAKAAKSERDSESEAEKPKAAKSKGKKSKPVAEESESEQEVSSDSEEEEVKPKAAKAKSKTSKSKTAPVKGKGRSTATAAVKSLKSGKAAAPKNLKVNAWGNNEEKDNTSGVVYRMVGRDFIAIGTQDTSKKRVEKHLKSVKALTEDERKSAEDRGFTVLTEEIAEKAPAKDKAALKALAKMPTEESESESESEESESESE